MKDNNDNINLDLGGKPAAAAAAPAQDGLLKHLWVSIVATLTLAVIVCGAYPLVVWGLSQLIFHDKANGSLITSSDGTVIASRLIGQSFSDAKYFHPRPSANSYDPTNTGGSNLGPMSAQLFNGTTQPTTLPNPKPDGDPLPGPPSVKFDGIQDRIVHYAAENPTAITLESSLPLKNFQDKDGNYDDVKLINAFNDGSLTVKATTANGSRPIPADAVTGSASGLDPHITPENADIQGERVAKARSVPAAEVRRLIAANTDGRDLGFLGEPGVNLITLNLALDKEHPVAPPATAPAVAPAAKP